MGIGVASIFGFNYSCTYLVGTCTGERGVETLGPTWRVSMQFTRAGHRRRCGGNDDELHDSRQDDKPDSNRDGRGAESKTNGVPHLNEIP